MSLEQDEILRKCQLNTPSSDFISKELDRDDEIKKYNQDSHSDFIIKKDIKYILVLYGFFLLISLYLLEAVVFQNQHLNEIFGLTPVPEFILKHKRQMLFCGGVGAAIYSIGLIYHLLTFWLQYLIVKEDGITNKMSVLGRGHIPYKEMDSMRFWCGHLAIKTKRKKRFFNFLKLSLQDKKKIDKLYYLGKKQS
jgi:hypothetical protein